MRETEPSTSFPLEDLTAVRTSPWRPAPERLRLGRGDVHAWRARYDVRGSSLGELQQILSADERERAARFRFPKDRNCFVAARGLLRVILGRYLDADPRELRFGYTTHGKPFLTTQSAADPLRFNLSHSDGLILYAITRGREIGIDVERVRSDLADEGIAERFFSPREVAELRGLPKHLRGKAFFACWTRKEAYIKARGEGLTFPLDQFEVSLVPGGTAALLTTRPDAEEASHWSLRHLDPAPGYVGALAVAGRDCRLRCWQWPDEGPGRSRKELL